MCDNYKIIGNKLFQVKCITAHEVLGRSQSRLLTRPFFAALSSSLILKLNWLTSSLMFFSHSIGCELTEIATQAVCACIWHVRPLQTHWFAGLMILGKFAILIVIFSGRRLNVSCEILLIPSPITMPILAYSFFSMSAMAFSSLALIFSSSSMRCVLAMLLPWFSHGFP